MAVSTILDQFGNAIQRNARERGRELGSGYRASAFGEGFDAGFGLDDGSFGDVAYEGASATNPDLAGFTPFNYSGQSALTFTRDRLATRIHQLVRDNGWTSAAVSHNLDAVIGSGWRLHSIPNAEVLGIEQEAAQELAFSIETAWRDYATDPDSCDAAQSQDMAGILALAYRHMLIDGEAFSISHWIDDESQIREYSTAIQIVDPDRLSNPYLYLDTINRKAGIELDQYGAPVGYHFRTAHPGDLGVIGAFPWRWEFLDKKYANGRWKVIHSFRPMRGGQVRGEPPLAPILRKVRMVTKYDTAELQAAVLNALLAAFVQSPNDPEQVMGSLEGEDEVSPQQAHRLGFYEKCGLRIPNVRVNFLYPNDQVNLLQPKHPNQNFESFMRVGLRNIASAAGITYEALSGDWSGVNYSSARAAILEVWRGFAARKTNFASIFLRPHFSNWMEEAIELKKIKLPKGAPPFRDVRNAYTQATWIGPSVPHVDILKESQAAVTRITAGISTLQIECESSGQDWKEIVLQRARERAYMLENGLDPDSLTQTGLPRGLKPSSGEKEEPIPPEPGEKTDDVSEKESEEVN